MSRFRHQFYNSLFYNSLTRRADALFDLTEAVLCADGPVTSLAELSLSAAFRRGHGALYDALAAGQIAVQGVRDALVQAVPSGAPLLFAVDVTPYPRPDAECSADRAHCYATCRCDGSRKTIQGGTIPGSWAWSGAARRGPPRWTLADRPATTTWSPSPPPRSGRSWHDCARQADAAGLASRSR